MDIVGQPFHVGKFLVRLQHALRVAFSLPGVVDVDIHVPGVLHSGGYQCVRDFLHNLGIDFFRELIPAIPAHGRRLGERLRHAGGSEKQADKQANERSRDHSFYETTFQPRTDAGPLYWTCMASLVSLGPLKLDTASLDRKQEKLFSILASMRRVIVAYSGGTDSAYLAWAA